MVVGTLRSSLTGRLSRRSRIEEVEIPVAASSELDPNTAGSGWEFDHQLNQESAVQCGEWSDPVSTVNGGQSGQILPQPGVMGEYDLGDIPTRQRFVESGQFRARCSSHDVSTRRPAVNVVCWYRVRKFR